MIKRGNLVRTETRAPLVDDISNAAFKTPADWLGTFPAVYVFGPEIVPETTYEVQVDNGTAGCPMLSWPTLATSALFGDVSGPAVGGVSPPPDGIMNIADVTASLDAFSGQPTPLFHFADIDPVDCEPTPATTGSDQIDIIDIVALLDAFAGIQFAEATFFQHDCAASPCPVPPPSGPSGNPYFFTGRRLDFDQHDDATGNPTLTLYHYRARGYDALNGRFTQRDPAGYVDGMNLYQYVRSSPTNLNDSTGQWLENVHRDMTAFWAVDEGMTPSAALSVGEADIGTDGASNGTSFLPVFGQQFRHFNRNPAGAVDSRLQTTALEMWIAKRLCNKTRRRPRPRYAALHLGRSLHSIQDWWAHGDYSSGAPYVLEPHSGEYDTWGLDAVWENGNATPQGRAPKYLVQSYIFFVSETSWPNWKPGFQRSTGTERDTRSYLRKFVSWLKTDGHCRCKQFFLAD